MIWCWALNRAQHGEPIDYFAMIHADVEAEDFWLDKMISELESNDLDVLSAVVPIKDSKGLTSTALERPDGSTWYQLCRLSMREVCEDLPVTFTADDVGHPLLLNTGCWVAKFDLEWAKQVRFTINDRIVFSEKKDMYIPQVESEDWYFSRLLNEMELKIGATRAIEIEHIGKAKFPNNKVWGTDHFDVQSISKSVLDDKVDDDFEFPTDVDGWLLAAEGRALADAVRDKRVLEIGTYCGLSTICMAQTAESVVSIDPHDGRYTPKPRDTYQECCNNLERYGVADKVILHRTIEKSDVAYQEYDAIFIDGAHDLESVKSDIAASLDLLADDGILMFHDYRENPGDYDGRWNPGVTGAVDEFIRDGAEIVSRTASMVVIRPPALKPLEA